MSEPTRCSAQVLRGNSLSYCYNAALPGTNKCARHTKEPKRGVTINLTREEAFHTAELLNVDNPVRLKIEKALASKPWEEGWKPCG